MRNLPRALLAGSLVCALGLLAGCGGSGAGLLTGNQASAIQNQLDTISSALSSGNCGAVRTGTRNLADQVASLPTTVNGSLRQALDFQANQVSTLSVRDCHPTSTTTTTSSTPTTTTNTAPTTTATTPTTTTNTTPTTTTPATTTTNPGTTSGGGGLPGGNGGGAGIPGVTTGNGNGNGQ